MRARMAGASMPGESEDRSVRRGPRPLHDSVSRGAEGAQRRRKWGLARPQRYGSQLAKKNIKMKKKKDGARQKRMPENAETARHGPRCRTDEGSVCATGVARVVRAPPPPPKKKKKVGRPDVARVVMA